MINNIKNTKGCFNINKNSKGKRLKWAKKIHGQLTKAEIYHMGKVRHQKICTDIS